MAEERVLAGISLTLQQVHQERLSHLRKWGIQEHSPEKWLSILTEELGEVAKEINEEFSNEMLDVQKYRKELIQVAAVAAAAVQCIDTGTA